VSTQPPAGPATSTRWAALYYFAFFSAIGILIPYMNLHYQEVGLDAGRIGVLAALPTVVSLLASPFWGVLADRLNLHKIMLPAVMVISALAMFVLLNLQVFAWMAVLVLVQSFFGSPIGPMADNAILEMLGAEGRHRYGSLRLWGAIGFGITSWVAGWLIDRIGLGFIAYGYASVFCLAAWVAAHLPAPRFIAPPKVQDLKVMLRNLGWRGLLISMFFMGLAASIHANYFVLNMKALGAPSAFFGAAFVVSSLSEIVVFLLVPRLIQRGHARTLVIVGFVAWIVREALCAVLRDPVLLVATQVLHGLAFSALWTATITLARDMVPSGWGATAQALLASVAWGAAWGLGALLGGQLLQLQGASAMFMASAVCALIGLLVFVATQRASQQPEREPVPRLA
jgi:MFS transporter, PPP family, 3-phenylpropionic acid transporter